jgi:pimeloyl-ACP methyl ester carboxylesterase
MLPVSLLFHHEMDSATALKGSKVPVALIAAAQDQLIGAARTEGLRRAVGNLVFDRVIERAGHNDVYDRSEFHQAMRDALAAFAADE